MFEQLQKEKVNKNASTVFQKKTANDTQTTDDLSHNSYNPIQMMSFSNSVDDDKSVEFLTERNENNTGIPTQMKREFEEKSGFSFDDVKVHYNSNNPAKLQALAYTQGSQVYIGPGQEKHLPHELGHVVQQKQGIVHANSSENGLPLNDNPILEEEANLIQKQPSHVKQNQEGVVQRQPMQDVIQRLTLQELLANCEDPDETDIISALIRGFNDPNFPQYDIVQRNRLIAYEANIIFILNQMEHLGFSRRSIIKLICGAAMNVAQNLMGPFAANAADNIPIKLLVLQMFRDRLNLLSTYTYDVMQDPNVLGQYDVLSTGSDPHVHGKHALYLMQGGVTRRVHKGHRLEVDRAFVGQGGILEYFNSLFGFFELLFSPIGWSSPFAIMEIDPLTSTESFMQKKEEFTEDEARKYYFQMGMLECASQVIGATDLHQDNILPTARGPLAIDAECTFVHTRNQTLIQSHALTQGQGVGGVDAVARFIIVKSDGQRVNSDEEYNANPAYQLIFQQGYNVMLRKLRGLAQTPAFRQNITRIIGTVTFIRVLPWSTGDLAQSLSNYNVNILENHLQENQVLIDTLIEEMANYLVANIDVAHFNITRTEQVLILAFSSRTIPAVEINIHTQEILVDGVSVGHISISVASIVNKIIDLITSLQLM